ncbi:11349_t:CDS:2, partial [Dentiscutata erythropus]
MKEITQQRLNLDTKSQGLRFKIETPNSLKKKLKYNLTIKSAIQIVSQDKTFKHESPDTFRVRNQLKHNKPKPTRKLKHSKSLPSESKFESRPKELPRSSSLPNNTSFPEAYYLDAVSNVSFSSLNTTQNIICSYPFTEEPETYSAQEFRQNNELYDDIDTVDSCCPSNSKVNISLYENTSDTSDMPVCCHNYSWHSDNSWLSDDNWLSRSLSKEQALTNTEHSSNNFEKSSACNF